MLYFAYASNMDWKQIKDRCPTACFVCIAKLPEHNLDFTRLSKKRKSGVADVLPCENAEVWGVVYKIDEIDIKNLDGFEGYKPGQKENAYIRVEIMVYEDGNKDKPITCYTYEVQNKGKHEPSKEYLDVIINGAVYWHLPERYIEQLKTIHCKED